MANNFQRGFKQSVVDFCKNSTITGHKYMVRYNTNVYEKTLWFLINAISLVSAIYLTLALWNRFNDNPILTSLDSTNYPVKYVDFPAISICDLNKISKWKSHQLAIQIANRTNHDVQYISNRMILLGNLYDYDMYYSTTELVEFQSIIDMYNQKVPKKLSIFDIMYQISPSCDDFLKSCTWGGKERNCNELFRKRLTFEGFCCTFNYLKPGEKIAPFPSKDIAKQEVGLKNGLNVILEFNTTDYLYTIIASTGGMIHIFNPFDYPDIVSGSLIEKLFSANDEYFVTLSPTILNGIHEILRLPVSKRECLFNYERKTVLGDYSQSDCNVECRIKSMMKLCRCVSFLFPIQEQHDNYCTLADIQCLSKYKGKWSSVYPYGIKDFSSLEREKEYSLVCEEQCYSTCDATLYEVISNRIPLRPNNSRGLGKNNSIVHIYYDKDSGDLYKKDVLFYWFEILSTFGGMSSLVIGVSIISVIEILFCFTYRVILFSKT